MYIGVEKPTVDVDSAAKTDDPFAAQRDDIQNGEKAASPTAGSPIADRRLSADEWGKLIATILCAFIVFPDLCFFSSTPFIAPLCFYLFELFKA